MKAIHLLPFFISYAVTSSFDDIVENLPDMGEFKSFKLYSGYLDVKGSA
jgi:hypothetical protein